MKAVLMIGAIVGSFVAGSWWSVYGHRSDALIRNIDGVSVAQTAPGFEPRTSTVTLHIGKRQYVLWLDTGFTKETPMIWHGGPQPEPEPMITHGNVRRMSMETRSAPCGDTLPSTQMLAALTLDRQIVPKTQRLHVQCYVFEGSWYPSTASAQQWVAATTPGARLVR